MSKTQSNTLTALIFATGFLLAACGDDSPGSINASTDDETSEPEPGSSNELRAASDFGRITLDWTADGRATLLYSTDPNCNWDIYSTCADSGMLLDQDPGLTLGVDDGLALDQNYVFVAETTLGRTETQAAAAWAPSLVNRFRFDESEASLVHNGIWYMGGRFSRAAPSTGSGAIFNAESGVLEGALQQVAGLVQAVIPDGNGGWYIGGGFDIIGGKEQSHLAHIRADGSLNPDWQPDVENILSSSLRSRVEDLMLHDGVLYVAGRFREIDGQTRNRLAAFDIHTGDLTDWAPSIDDNQGWVSALAAAGDRIVFGGQFDRVDGQERHNLAAAFLDGELAPFAPQLQISSYLGAVEALAIVDHYVIAGGEFDQIENSQGNNLAIYDLDTGDFQSWGPDLDGPLHDLAVSGNTVYMAGDFDDMDLNGTEYDRRKLAAFDLNAREITSWHPDSPTYASYRALHIEDDTVFLGGSFTVITADQENRNLMAVDLTSGAARPWSFSTDGHVYDLALSGNRLYVGGGFHTAGGVARDNLMAFHAHTGELLDWAPEFTALFNSSSRVYALQADAGRLYVGGEFNDVNGEPRGSLAAFDLTTGELDDWQPDAADGTRDGRVRTLLLQDDTLYVGGIFDQVDGHDRQSVAALSTMNSGGTWDPQLRRDGTLNPIVYDLVTLGDDLMIGGRFEEVQDNTEQRNLAQVSLQTGGTTEHWAPSPEASVTAIAISADHLFTGFFGGPGPLLAAYSIEDMTLNENWSPVQNTNDNLINQLVATDSRLIVAGNFNADGKRYLVSYNLSDLTLDPHWGPEFNGRVSEVFYHDGRIYGMGEFDRVDGRPRSGLVVLDAETGEVIH